MEVLQPGSNRRPRVSEWQKNKVAMPPMKHPCSYGADMAAYFREASTVQRRGLHGPRRRPRGSSVSHFTSRVPWQTSEQNVADPCRNPLGPRSPAMTQMLCCNPSWSAERLRTLKKGARGCYGFVHLRLRLSLIFWVFLQYVCYIPIPILGGACSTSKFELAYGGMIAYLWW